MEILLLLTYAAICICIFKLFKIPLNKWTIPTAVLGGVVIIGALVFAMNYNHPHSKSAVRGFISTPIVPNVRGLVIDVPVEANVPIKKDTVLFKIDPEPYQFKVNQMQAALDLAKAQVDQMTQLVAQSQAAVERATSERDRTKQSFERFSKTAASGAVSANEVENKRQIYLGAEASLDEAKANLAIHQLERDSQVHNVIPEHQAALSKAQFNLDSTIVCAPSDGYVTQIKVRPGMMAVSMPLKPTMVFIPNQKHFVVASFRQNALQRLKPGYQAEIMFPSIPGKVFTAEVSQMFPALGEGEFQASGTLMETAEYAKNKRGLVPVMLAITDDMSEYTLPDGIFAEVAVYSEHLEHVALLRKILLRMKSWENYIYLDH